MNPTDYPNIAGMPAKNKRIEMSDNGAVMEGFTQEIQAEPSNGEDLFLLVKPGTDFESTFKAWDTDAQEWIRVNGWNYIIRTDGDCKA